MSDAPATEDVRASDIKVGDQLVFLNWTCPVRGVERRRDEVQLRLARIRVGVIDEDYFRPTFALDATVRRIVP